MLVILHDTHTHMHTLCMYTYVQLTTTNPSAVEYSKSKRNTIITSIKDTSPSTTTNNLDIHNDNDNDNGCNGNDNDDLNLNTQVRSRSPSTENEYDHDSKYDLSGYDFDRHNSIRNDTIIVSASKRITKKSIELGVNQQKLIDLIAKYLILVLLSQSVTLLVVITMIAITFITSMKAFILSVYWLYLAMIMDSFVNIICVYLQFAFASHHYKKIFGRCHKDLDKRMQQIAIRKLTASMEVQSQLNKTDIEIEE